MASSISIAKSAAQAQDASLNGIKRSRFSFHFNTPRTRRWLLVQMVTAPANVEEDDTTIRHHNMQTRAAQPNLREVMDGYCNSSMLRRWV